MLIVLANVLFKQFCIEHLLIVGGSACTTTVNGLTQTFKYFFNLDIHLLIILFVLEQQYHIPTLPEVVSIN